MKSCRAWMGWCLIGLWGLLAFACGPSNHLKGPGEACQKSDECDQDQKLECRAKKCRTIQEKKPPIARATALPSTPEVGQKVQLDGKDSRDPLDYPLTYQWTLQAKPSGSKSKLADADKAIATIIPDKVGKYTFKLVVSVGEGSDLRKAETQLTFTAVDRPNSAPHADAGPDQLLEPNSKVQLDGSGSSDPDGDKLSYQWTFQSKPQGSTAKLSNATDPKPTFVGELEGDYILSLVVTDERGAKSPPDSVTIRILEGASKKPILTKVTPNKGPAYELKYAIVLEGNDFYKDAKVQLGTHEFPTTYVGRTKLQAKVNLALVGQGTHHIAVVNPNGLSSAPLQFTVTEVPPPKLTSMTPPRGHIGTQLKVKVKGANFIVGRSEILFQSVPLPTRVLSPTELEFDLDLRNTPVGKYPVVVNNPGNRASNTLEFQVLDQLPKPILRVLNPPSGKTGSKIAFSVHGQSFGLDAVIVFNGQKLKSKRIRSDEIQADPNLDLTNVKPGEYDVWVRNPDGQISNKEKFRVSDIDPAPKLDRMLPFTLYLDQVMKDVAVYGQDFVPGSKLFIDNKEITGALGQVVYRSDTFLLAEINLTDRTIWPKPGDFQAYVQNPNGKKSAPFKLTLTYLIPSVSTLVPSSWTNKCDTDVEVQGSNFVKGVQVKFGNIIYKTGSTTHPLTYVSDKLLRFHLPAKTLGVGSFKVVVENGPQASTTAPNFKITSGSTLTPYPQYVRPSFGKADTTVNISIRPDSSQKPNGFQSFKPGAVVELNGKKQPTTCSSFSSDYCYNLNATLDLSGLKAGDYDLYVVNPCDVRSAPLTFIVEPPPKPYISALKPPFAKIGDKVKITILGANFSKNHTLTWGGQTLKTTFKSEKELETTDPIDFSNAKLGDIDVVVKNGNGQQTDTVKFSVLSRYHPTITEVTPDSLQRGSILPTVTIKGTGFVLTSLILLNGKPTPSKFVSPTTLQMTGVDASKLPAGTYLIQVKSGSRASNFFPLQLTPVPPPRIDYTNPSNMIAGSKTSFTLYIYGSNFSRQPDASLVFKAPDGTDLTSKRWTVAYVSSSYMRGTLNVAGLAAGKYTIQVKNPTGQLSNRVIFRIAPPPPPIAISVSPPRVFRGSPKQRIQIIGSNFVNGDVIIFNNNRINHIPGTAITPSTLEGVLDLSQIHYGGNYDIYVLRCHDQLCSKFEKTQTLKLLVSNPPCSLVKCETDMPNKEKCDLKSTPNVCRPPCTTNADCTKLNSQVTWACTDGVCK